ncbi:MAG: hypothetical protein AB1831_10550 [Pseudomonadota bacterium]
MNSKSALPAAFLLALATSLYIPVAQATLIVSGTSDSGLVGEHLQPTLTVSSDEASPDEVDLGHISAWDFKLDWGAAPLSLNVAGSSMTIGGNTYALSDLFNLLDPTATEVLETSGAGFYTFSWFDSDVSGAFDMTGGFAFTADFVASTPGTYAITFGPQSVASSLLDEQFLQFDYAEVSQGQGAMQVTARPQPTPAPEPDVLALVVGGFAALGFARRRRGT